MRKALITGASGQDGSYLIDLLLSKGYEVHGIIRPSSNFNTKRIEHHYKDPRTGPTNLYLHHGDMTDASSLRNILGEVKPDEIYNLAAQSHVQVSFKLPEYTADVVALGTIKLLDAYKDICPDARFYQASSSEMFGNAPAPQNEKTPFMPASPYACAKVMAHNSVVNYRKSHKLFACCGILFNHESPRRGETFVTRKITRALGQILTKQKDKLYLGNLDARRDWGFAGDYVEAMWMMLQQDGPDDYVIATGESYSVRHFLDTAFRMHGMDYQEFVQFDPRYLRPCEVDYLEGDSSKARQILGWEPKVSYYRLVEMMVEQDYQLAKKELVGQRV